MKGILHFAGKGKRKIYKVIIRTKQRVMFDFSEWNVPNWKLPF